MLLIQAVRLDIEQGFLSVSDSDRASKAKHEVPAVLLKHRVPYSNPHAGFLCSKMQRPQVALDSDRDGDHDSQHAYQKISIPLTRLALNTQRWRADYNALDLVFLGSRKVAVVIGARAKVQSHMGQH